MAATTAIRRVFLVDDAPIVRGGIREMLGHNGQFAVVAEAADPAVAVGVAVSHQPDIIVIEARIGGRSSTAAIRELRQAVPAARILVFTSHPDFALAFDAIAAGADGYLLKRASAEELVDALRTVARGEAVVDPAIATRIFATIRQGSWGWVVETNGHLSPRDNRLLELVAEGKSNREIAADLNLAEQTVKNHLSLLMHRLGIRRRVQVTQYLARLAQAAV